MTKVCSKCNNHFNFFFHSLSYSLLRSPPLGIALSCFCKFTFIVEKRFCLSLGNREKSQEVMFAEGDDSGFITVLCFAKNCWKSTAVRVGALCFRRTGGSNSAKININNY